MVAALLVSGVLAFAQVCPSGYSVIPGTSASAVTIPSTVMVPGYTLGTIPYGTVSSVPTCNLPNVSAMQYPSLSAIQCPSLSAMQLPSMSTMQLPNLSAAASGVTSQDTACLLSEIRALRAEVAAQSLNMQGQTLANRLNQLTTSEQVFRQAIIANPNLPNAQLIALQLSAEAQALNRDIANYARALSLVPADLRPYMAASLSQFDVATWQPALQSFSAYQASLPASLAIYQPAFAQNPWLQTWFTNYQTALVPLSQTPLTVASVRWWTNQPMVLGSAQMFPGIQMGAASVLPSGAVIFIPAGVAATTGMIGTTTAGLPLGTIGTPQIGVLGTTETMGTMGTMGTTGTMGTMGTTGTMGTMGTTGTMGTMGTTGTTGTTGVLGTTETLGTTTTPTGTTTY